MHKAIYLEGRLDLSIAPAGPILIKAGESSGADPTRPDMEFVRTRYRHEPGEGETPEDAAAATIYIPGPSLKGVVRAQAERIARTLDRAGRNPEGDDPPLVDNPQGKSAQYAGVDDTSFSSGAYFTTLKNTDEFKKLDSSQQTARIYRRSSFVSQLFGHTSLAGRVRFADAYGAGVVAEERNGVAIDRIYGSVIPGGLFNYETVVAGQFTTVIDFKNVTLAQLALLGLALRDLAEGRVAIGFGKSRGLGRVNVTFDRLTLRYPTCEVHAGKLRLLNGRDVAEENELAGVGVFERQTAYGFPTDDTAILPGGMIYQPDQEWGIGVVLRAGDDQAVRDIWKACMPAWKRAIGWVA